MTEIIEIMNLKLIYRKVRFFQNVEYIVHHFNYYSYEYVCISAAHHLESPFLSSMH